MLAYDKRYLRDITRHKGAELIFKNSSYIDFASNDYLGFSNHPKILQDSLEKCKQAQHFGATSSRLLSGNYALYEEVEKNFASFLAKESALIFSSGYQLNVSLFKSLLSKDDIVFCDKLIHASIIDGLKLAESPFKRFKHNDIDHLEILLKKYRHQYKKAWIVVEGIYSMDGDLCPLKQIIKLKKKYDLCIYLDEAHSFGVLGNGKGLAFEKDCSQDIDLLSLTFGKSLGSQGACLLSTNEFRDVLTQKCRGLIYSTALPSFTLIYTLTALNFLKKNLTLGKEVLHKSYLLKSYLKNLPLTILGDSQILALVFNEKETLIACCNALQEHQLFALPIFHPTVPKTSPRIRLSITAHHQQKDFSLLKQVLNNSL